MGLWALFPKTEGVFSCSGLIRGPPLASSLRFYPREVGIGCKGCNRGSCSAWLGRVCDSETVSWSANPSLNKRDGTGKACGKRPRKEGWGSKKIRKSSQGKGEQGAFPRVLGLPFQPFQPMDHRGRLLCNDLVLIIYSRLLSGSSVSCSASYIQIPLYYF